jgi:hypothetical protein
MIIDDTEDDADWMPVFWQDHMPLDMILYPVQKSFATSNYRQFTKVGTSLADEMADISAM